MLRPLIAVLACLPLAACLERIETIDVSPDGSAVLKSVFKGDASEFDGPDTLPGPPQLGSPWLVTDEPDKADPKKMTRTAELRVPARGEFPGTYLPTSDDRRTSRILNFPTTLNIVHAPAGDSGIASTSYDFKRTYQRRDDARYTLQRRLFESDDSVKDLRGVDPVKLTDEQRLRLVRALARIEGEKHLQFADAGIAAVGKRWPQEIGLLVRQAVTDRIGNVDGANLAAQLGRPDSEERNAAIAAAVKSFGDGIREAVVKQMSALGVPPDDQALFMAGAEQEADRRAVTEDLGDERWEVRVTLPGVVAAHNGDRVEGNTVVWTFTGPYLMDRDQTLMASSRIDEKK